MNDREMNRDSYGILIRQARLFEREARMIGVDIEVDTQRVIEKLTAAHAKSTASGQK